MYVEVAFLKAKDTWSDTEISTEKMTRRFSYYIRDTARLPVVLYNFTVKWLLQRTYLLPSS